MNPVHTVCVCGSGTMGTDIAELSARSGYYTLLYDIQSSALAQAESKISNRLRQLQEKGKITAELAESTLSRLKFTDHFEECLADVFIEAIVEKEDYKVALMNQLAEINHSEVVFATNTSSLSVTRIAEKVQHPERVIGMHFFNPATIMKLVEVVVTPFTAPYAVDTVRHLAETMGKTSVICRDVPGFIVNRVARPYYLEALRIAEELGTDYTLIDRIMEATGFRMGPFRLMDLIGNDVNYAVSCSVYEQLGKPDRLKPSALQEKNVKEGKLGVKSGEGFYKY
ncbi:MAG: 3-hydroxyacyl-CoA dehydrogenase NAD-binding domain-containing protein [Chitinophagaceae bacterium]|nr:3-hydroxyacyl-CoA dehydrogenase NAD-binding domain-containing protein [Chitinophagaceae bacterium]